MILTRLAPQSAVVWMALILVIASAFRLFNLEHAPSGALIDEASYGYISYSLIQTGTDELGHAWPLHFRAFGDQKLPMYGYVLMPFVKLFGLSNFAVRLPSALAGILLVPLMYLLARKLGMTMRQGLIAAMVAAVSPWTIILSRFGYESNLALLLFAVGVYCMLASVQSKRLVWVVCAAIMFGLCWYAYIPYRVITTLGMLIYGVVLLKSRRAWMGVAVYIVVFLSVIAPLIPHTLSSVGSSRLNQAQYIHTRGSIHSVEDRRSYCQRALPDAICKVFVNKYITSASNSIVRYLLNFGPNFLFFRGEGDILMLSVQGYGALYWPLVFLYVAGAIWIFSPSTRHARTLSLVLVLALTAISAIPSAIVGDPQRVRLSAVVPGIILVISWGYGAVERLCATRGLHLICFVTLGGVLWYCAGMFGVDLFTVHYPKYLIEYSSHLREASEYIHNNIPEETLYYEGIGENFPLYYAYYTSVDPADYQRYAVYTSADVIGFSHPVSFRNIMMKDRNTDELICSYRAQKKRFSLMTSEDLVRNKTLREDAVYTVKSGDGNSRVLNIYRVDPRLYTDLCTGTPDTSHKEL